MRKWAIALLYMRNLGLIYDCECAPIPSIRINAFLPVYIVVFEYKKRQLKKVLNFNKTQSYRYPKALCPE
jgi:hypothetical protein